MRWNTGLPVGAGKRFIFWRSGALGRCRSASWQQPQAQEAFGLEWPLWYDRLPNCQVTRT